jgi:hypothetical protein
MTSGLSWNPLTAGDPRSPRTYCLEVWRGACPDNARGQHCCSRLSGHRTGACVCACGAVPPPPAGPVDPELFRRTAPEWNCVDFPGEGMHYRPGPGACLWCGR